MPLVRLELQPEQVSLDGAGVIRPNSLWCEDNTRRKPAIGESAAGVVVANDIRAAGAKSRGKDKSPLPIDETFVVISNLFELPSHLLLMHDVFLKRGQDLLLQINSTEAEIAALVS